MIDNLKQNIEQEKRMVKEMLGFCSKLEKIEAIEKEELKVDVNQKRMLQSTLNSLAKAIGIINNSFPSIIDNIKIRELPGYKKEADKELVKISYGSSGEYVKITIKDSDRMRFLKEISLIDRKSRKERESYNDKKIQIKPRIYAKIANKIFFNISSRIIDGGYFKNTELDLKKANLPYIVNSYISMALLSGTIAFVLGTLFSFLLFYYYSNWQFFWIAVGLPAITIIGYYFYPEAEKQSVERGINQELPFVVIHMSAIASSGIEPSSIFEIIAKSGEYKHTGFEIKKMINQVNLYGLDLVTALRNSAKTTGSLKLSELFNGLASNISSGGSLESFFDKRAESLLLDYKLEREKYTKSIDTFMNVYIAVVIAAPFIMMMLLIMFNLTSMNIGISTNALSIIMISAVAFINIIFIMFLSIRQPSY